MDVAAWSDQQDAWLVDVIRRHRWAIQYVGEGCSRPGCIHLDEGPPFAYTIGLFGMGHPELLVFSLSPEESARVLNQVASRVEDGESLLPGFEITVSGRRIIPEPVPNPGEIVFTANRFYQRPDEASVPVLQLTYCDQAGRFPWDDGYAHPGDQPRPGTFRA